MEEEPALHWAPTPGPAAAFDLVTALCLSCLIRPGESFCLLHRADMRVKRVRAQAVRGLAAPGDRNVDGGRTVLSVALCGGDGVSSSSSAKCSHELQFMSRNSP